MAKIKKEALIELLNLVTKYSKIEEECAQKYAKINFLYLKLASFLLHKNEDLSQKKLEELRKLLEDCIVKLDIEGFLDKLQYWLLEYLPTRLKRLNYLKEIFHSIDCNRTILDSMHYKDEDKIDAETFMRESGIDEDLIEELEESLKDFKEIEEFNVKLNQEYIEDILKVSATLRKIFTFSGEFKDLSLAFENLEKILIELNLNEIDEDKKTLLKSFIDSIFNDIEKWVEEVIIKQTAKDIHYLDAALFANIEQIKILLTNHHNKHDDDIEFF